MVLARVFKGAPREKRVAGAIVQSENPDRHACVNLFLDLTLRQVELDLRFADFANIKKLTSEALQFCPIHPDPKSPFLCRSAVRLFILQIEVADHARREAEMFGRFAKLHEIPKASLNPRPQATLTRLEGIQRALPVLGSVRSAQRIDERLRCAHRRLTPSRAARRCRSAPTRRRRGRAGAPAGGRG
jgi:hypothetical protein